MNIVKTPHIFIFVFLVGFIGQSMAAIDVSCSMPGEIMSGSEMLNESTGNAMPMMDHSTHAMNFPSDNSGLFNTLNQNPTNEDCCEESSSCSMSSCVLSASTPSEISKIPFTSTTIKIDFYAFSDIEYENGPLFRPPVIR